MNNIQELKGFDSQRGFFANESAAAFNQTQCMQEYPCEQHKAQKLVESGRYVIVQQYPVFGRSTDAILGEAYVVLSDHSSREEANLLTFLLSVGEACQSDVSFHVEPPRTTPLTSIYGSSIPLLVLDLDDEDQF